VISKKRSGLPYKREFTGKQMREIALTYKKIINDAKIYIVEDPLEQLHLTIKKNLWFMGFIKSKNLP
jgi:pyruvate,orthophosphate dikinase